MAVFLFYVAIIKSKYAHIAFSASKTLALRGCVNTKYDVCGPDVQTSAGRLSLIPLGIVGVHAFNGNRPLFQSIPRITSKFHHSSHCPCVVTTGQVTVLHEGFVAVSCCKGCGRKIFSVEITFIKQQVEIMLIKWISKVNWQCDFLQTINNSFWFYCIWGILYNSETVAELY